MDLEDIKIKIWQDIKGHDVRDNIKGFDAKRHGLERESIHKSEMQAGGAQELNKKREESLGG